MAHGIRPLIPHFRDKEIPDQLIKEIEDRNKNRYKYANQFIRISYLSLIFVGCMVVADGYEGIRFDLSDPVIITLLGTALSTVLAPTYLLAKYIFKHDGGGASNE